jgi:hypothetical protein
MILVGGWSIADGYSSFLGPEIVGEWVETSCLSNIRYNAIGYPIEFQKVLAR